MKYREYLTDRTLHRFLTARNNDVTLTQNMLLQHLEWRVSYRVDEGPGLADEDFSLFDALDELYWHGFDGAGQELVRSLVS